MALKDALSALVLLHRLDASLSELIAVEKQRLEVDQRLAETLELALKLACMAMNLSPEAVRSAVYAPDGTGATAAELGQGSVEMPTHDFIAHLDELRRRAEEMGVKVDDDTDLEAFFDEKAERGEDVR